MRSDAMSDRVDAEQLYDVLTAHPWLIKALREADWWIREDGTVRFLARFEDHEDVEAGFVAFAEALGHEVTTGVEPPLADPDDVRR
jgi:hypothetical protein